MEWVFDIVVYNLFVNGKIGVYMWVIGVNDMCFFIFCLEYGYI